MDTAYTIIRPYSYFILDSNMVAQDLINLIGAGIETLVVEFNQVESSSSKVLWILLSPCAPLGRYACLHAPLQPKTHAISSIHVPRCRRPPQQTTFVPTDRAGMFTCPRGNPLFVENLHPSGRIETRSVAKGGVNAIKEWQLLECAKAIHAKGDEDLARALQSESILTPLPLLSEILYGYSSRLHVQSARLVSQL